ncbi:MAG: hypothetical protein R3Y21_04505 [Mycoplasmatota bacterium]
MKKIFLSSAYKVKHKDISKANVIEKLSDDLRSKLVGVQNFVYARPETKCLVNDNLLYTGGFYYEEAPQEKLKFGECENVVNRELKEIDDCDIFIVSLLEYCAIASVTELIYAAFKDKKIIVFLSEKITQFKTEYEYWFPVITSLKMNNNVELIYVNDEIEIINYIKDNL